jgi:hypothetical protein
LNRPRALLRKRQLSGPASKTRATIRKVELRESGGAEFRAYPTLTKGRSKALPREPRGKEWVDAESSSERPVIPQGGKPPVECHFDFVYRLCTSPAKNQDVRVIFWRNYQENQCLIAWQPS